MGLSLKQFMIECSVFRLKRKLPLIATISRKREREKERKNIRNDFNRDR